MILRSFAGAGLRGLATFLLISSAADAAVVISSKPTKNMSCSGGVCTPTKAKAVLNVTDLANMLASGDVKVVADSKAVDIDVADSLTWVSTSRLALDSYHSLVFERPVTIAGTGALTITTNDGGTGGDFWFVKKGHVEFWDLHSSLVINGNSYKLVKIIKQLAKAIAVNPSGFYALAKTYNASSDGTYAQSPISTDFFGTFEGLGNSISNVSVNDTGNESAGFFHAAYGGVHNFNLVNINIVAQAAGGMAAVGGNIIHSSVTGSVFGSTYYAGGLIGLTTGGIRFSRADVDVTTVAGGLAGHLYGPEQTMDISYSYATGMVSGGDGSVVGGLVGLDEQGFILSSYATGSVFGGASAGVGGLVGGAHDATPMPAGLRAAVAGVRYTCTVPLVYGGEVVALLVLSRRREQRPRMSL